MLKKIIKMALVSLLLLTAQMPAYANENDCVILLHGLARTERSMIPMEKALNQSGYQVVNISYPSRKQRIGALARDYVGKAVKRCQQHRANNIHFVTHSLGGILVRYYMTKYELPELGRVVMLSPPNQGSEIVNILASTRFYYWINGPAGLQLSTKDYSVPNMLGPVDYPVGIITGNKSINPLTSYWIPGEDDGKVSVQRAKLKGMKAFKVVPHSHTYIQKSKRVIELTETFLKTGTFGDRDL